jgi:hypothetical protein
MPVNPIVNSYGTADEKRLLDDLTAEVVQQRGLDFLYLPRVAVNLDLVAMEDPLVRFEKAYTIEMYVENYEGFQGDSNFMDKFAGVHVRDQFYLTVARSTFEHILRPYKLTRPREGDMIFDPLTKRLFEIMFVERFQEFMPLGHQLTYGIRAELFESSGQTFATGIPLIDAMSAPSTSTDLLTTSLNSESGQAIRTETGLWWELDDSSDAGANPLDDGQRLQDEAVAVIDKTEPGLFTENDPWGEGVQ